MIYKIDIDAEEIIVEENGEEKRMAFQSAEGFEAISKLWLRSCWDNKYVYSFTWFDRPMIQFPEDMLRLQEVIVNVKPDVILECGVAHGGGSIFYASLCKMMGHGRVIGVDLEIRPHNRKALEEHPLASYLTLFEGSSTAPDIVAAIQSNIKKDEKALVILDSNHSYNHVMGELDAYHDLVGVGSYIVVCDGIIRELIGKNPPYFKDGWSKTDNPANAAEDWVKKHPNFVLEMPQFAFNESDTVKKAVTYWPQAYLKRIS